MIALRKPNSITFELIIELREKQNQFVGYSFDGKLGYKYNPDRIKERKKIIDNNRYFTII